MLFIAFGITLYILIFMYQRLDKDPFGESFGEFFGVLLPFVLLLITFTINLAGRQKSVNEHLFFNASCVISLTAILFFGYRALTDQNMVLWGKDGYGINFNYFADQITHIKVMVYVMLVIDILLIIQGRLNKKKELVLDE